MIEVSQIIRRLFFSECIFGHIRSFDERETPLCKMICSAYFDGFGQDEMIGCENLNSRFDDGRFVAETFYTVSLESFCCFLKCLVF